TVELGTGLWGTPLPYDYDGDGVMDLIVTCPDRPYRGTYFFRNIGTGVKPFFEGAVMISDKSSQNVRLGEAGGKLYVTAAGYDLKDFLKAPFESKVKIAYEGPVIGEGVQKIRCNTWDYVDWDADGDLDIIVGNDSWDDYGWDNAFDSEGRWANGPLHGWVNLLENVDGKYINRGRVQAAGKDIDVYGSPTPCVADFDGDGDLDLICGEFTDELTWFENIGTRQAPVFAAGRKMTDRTGKTIRFHVEMITPIATDFDGDGHPDLMVGDEDGSVAYLHNTGKVRKGMPQFDPSVKMMQKSDYLKFGALSTPCSFDWDGDGRDDIITGNSAGEIAWIRNMSETDEPVWSAPMLFRVGGKPIHIQAGPNGSIQGPAEKKWGYTVLSVADWDGDGRADIIVNSIWGKVVWYRNPGGRDRLSLAEAKPIKVAWDGDAPKPVWNWWNPVNGELVTQWRTTPVAMDWNKDGRCDLIMLDHEGWLAYYERLEDGRVAPGKRIFWCDNGSEYWNGKGMSVKPEPGPLRLNAREAGASGRRKICFVDWDKDGILDLVCDGPNAVWWQGRGAKKDGYYHLYYMGDLSSTRLEGHTTCPTPVDWDKDGIFDLLLGAEDGHFYLIKNPMTEYSERIEVYPGRNLPSEERLDAKGYIWGKIKPELLAYKPENPSGAAMLIVPGGGYEKNCITFEGYKTAQWLKANGVTAFILKYRLPEGHPEVTLEDGEAAIRLIRARAAEFGIDPHRIGIIGFSAGGHFCSTLLTKYSCPENRPDFGVLVYPVISYKYNNADTHKRLLEDKLESDGPAWTATNNVRPDMPPVMLVACEDDATVPVAQVKEFYEALVSSKVPAQLHLYPKGGHGFWMRDRYVYKEETYPMILNWILHSNNN
ncbi:MAG: VCBS repeat-containing protein, partial [Bacteroidales bacterium]|nr:VCBS repeat-containing protein [Bacteroidales bacterium]